MSKITTDVPTYQNIVENQDERMTEGSVIMEEDSGIMHSSNMTG